MIIRWFGHSCFEIKAKNVNVITDPYNDLVGYPMHSIGADYVTISHHHTDHDDISWVFGSEIIDDVGQFNYSDISFTGIKSYHDKKEGYIRGDNIIYKFEMDNISFCHLGDLGHVIDSKTWGQLGRIDVLFVPIGGNYTIGAEDAIKVIDAIDPYLAVGMHFKTDVCDFPIKTQKEFLKLSKGIQMKESSIKFDKKELMMSKNSLILDWVRD